MFTGIVEHVGRIESIEALSDLSRFVIDLGPISEGVGLGDSIAVAGCCLTVTTIDGTRFTFEAIRETLDVTRVGSFAEGDGVNLERAMGAGARFDGHIVQGHVDGTGRVRRLDRTGLDGNEVELHIECDPELAGQLVDKGSVTIEGVSLTVVKVVEDGFHVALIPHTLEVTTLSDLSDGDPVNLEVDVFGKYVKQYLDRVLPGMVAAK
ncbi:MAG: riboflavin synthase [Deltaproteobacteria bacterium]|nr:riboflavin synthase [Deltaproteobacteria bacterium]